MGIITQLREMAGQIVIIFSDIHLRFLWLCQPYLLSQSCTLPEDDLPHYSLNLGGAVHPRTLLLLVIVLTLLSRRAHESTYYVLKLNSSKTEAIYVSVEFV